MINQALEPLEPRKLFSTYLVSNDGDSILIPPAGSLRQAILSANANPGQDTITFALGPTGAPHVIALVGELPIVTGSLIIDGLSQGGAGYIGKPLIRLTCTNAPPDHRAFGLYFQNVGNNTVTGIAFTAFDTCVEFDNAGGGIGNNTFDHNYVGLSTDGLSPFSSKLSGIYFNSSDNNTITNNVIAASGTATGNAGIFQNNSSGNVFTGNFIGTAANGGFSIGGPTANGVGIYLANGSSNNRIGTDADGVNDAAERNVISNSMLEGIVISDAGSIDNVIAGNYIGLASNGVTAMGNGGNGIGIYGAANNRIGSNGDGVNDAAERNVISSNANNGLQISGTGANFNAVAGNFFGTDATGSLARPNVKSAVNIFGGAFDNTIAAGNPNISVAVGPSGGVSFTDDQSLAKLTLSDGFASIVTPARKTISIGELSITGSGLLDIGNNILLVNNALTPFNTLKTYWQAGYNNDSNAGYGLWDGNHGIISSNAKASAKVDGRITIGYLDGAAQNDPDIGNYAANIGGPSLATNQVIFRPTLMGDLNLDGVVNGDDIGILIGLGYYGKSSAPHGWFDGDLNGDGLVDGNDIGLIIGTGTYDNGSFVPFTSAAKTAPTSPANMSTSASGGLPASAEPLEHAVSMPIRYTPSYVFSKRKTNPFLSRTRQHTL